MSSYKKQREKYLSKVLALHRAGVTKGEILKEIPIQRRTMDRWIDQFAQIKHPSTRYHSWKKEQYYEKALQLHFEKGYGETTIAKFIPVGHTTIGRWIANFVAENGNNYQTAMKKKTTAEPTSLEDVAALKRKIVELESQLNYQTLRADAYDTMIDIAEKKFSIPIRKKSGAKR